MRSCTEAYFFATCCTSRSCVRCSTVDRAVFVDTSPEVSGNVAAERDPHGAHRASLQRERVDASVRPVVRLLLARYASADLSRAGANVRRRPDPTPCQPGER